MMPPKTLLASMLLLATFPTLVRGDVVVPIPTLLNVQYQANNHWIASIQYTATLMPDSVLAPLSGNMGFDPYGGTFTNLDYGASVVHHYITYKVASADELTGKLAAINKAIFGTDTPQSGQTSTGSYDHTVGAARDPYEHGYIPCVGTLLSRYVGLHLVPKGTMPPSFPANMCLVIPQAPAKCEFDVADASIHYGIILPGTHSGTVPVYMKCSRSTTVHVRLHNAAAGTTDVIESDQMKSRISINNQPLPYSTTVDGADTFNVTATSTIFADASGPVANSGTLYLSVE